VREDQASQTARRVAAQRRHFDRRPAEYGDPAADQRLHDDVAGDLPYSDTPFTAYLAARTGFFDTAVVDAIARGCPQLVVVGAGYDGRSLRYSKPGVRWFELDHPATLADKSDRLHRLDLDSDAVSRVAADFVHDDVGQRLAAAGHDGSLPTQFVCEGVTPYLDREVVVGLLTSLAARAAAGSQLAIDFALEADSEKARASREALRAVVESHGEPFRLELAKADLRTFVDDAGWEVRQAVDPWGADVTTSDRPTAFVTATPVRSRPELRVRPMTTAEFEAWRPRLVSEYAADHVRAGNWSEDVAEARSAQELQELLPQGVDTPGMLLFVAEGSAGEPVGHLWLAIGGRSDSVSKAYIYDIEIEAKYQGHGYGRALLRAAETECARHGASSIALTVFGVNQVARNLYESTGYEIATIAMRKKLSEPEAT
jgi:methyltransferase (TIGR00027 family)